MKEKSAGAIVFREDKERKYLILHYEEGHWDFPKGNIEEGESEKQTVIREVEEETGIKEIKFIEGFKEKINYFYTGSNKERISKEVILFLAETEEEDIKLSHEHVDHQWLDYSKALEKLTHDNTKNILRKAEAYLNTM